MYVVQLARVTYLDPSSTLHPSSIMLRRSVSMRSVILWALFCSRSFLALPDLDAYRPSTSCGGFSFALSCGWNPLTTSP